MKAAFVLGPITTLASRRLSGLNVDKVFYFSTHESSIAKEINLSQYSRLDVIQLNPKDESEIVERCIERNFRRISTRIGNNSVMRRALRLSELRIEARCFLAAVNFLKIKKREDNSSIDSVIFVSHYIVADDISVVSAVPMSWAHVPHSRFFGLLPGLSRLVTMLNNFYRMKFVH